MTTPLLEGLDGVNKMSKSLGNYIGITESPDDIYGKAMSISDDLMWRYYELLTDLTLDEITSLKTKVEIGEEHPRDVKSTLARRLVADFHSKQAADRAEEEFIRRFRQHEAPSDLETRSISIASGGLKLVDLLVDCGLAPSKAEARRLIAQSGVRINGDRVSDVATQVSAGDLLLQVGKLRAVRVLLVSK